MNAVRPATANASPCGIVVSLEWYRCGSDRWQRPDVADRAGVLSEPILFDAELLKHPHEQVREWRVFLTIVKNMPLVLEATTGEEDRQVLTGVGRGVAEVARAEYDRPVEKRGIAVRRLVHRGEKLAEMGQFRLLDDGQLLDLRLVLAMMRGIVVPGREPVEFRSALGRAMATAGFGVVAQAAVSQTANAIDSPLTMVFVVMRMVKTRRWSANCQ